MKPPFYLNKYKFCPLCSAKLIHKKEYIECSKCGHGIFDNVIPAVNVIIENKKNEILLTVRKVDPFKGWYDLPGGFIQTGETLEAAAKREIKEEIGVHIKIGSLIGDYNLEYEYQGLTYKLLTFVVSAVANSQKFVVGDDVSDIWLIHRSKVLDERICYPLLNKKALRKYLLIK